nr:venom protease-like [Onthophagus taurus]
MRFVINIFVIIILATSCVTTQEIGEQCILNDGSSGVCKLIFECVSAQNDLKLKIRPKHCGWNGMNPIVCCKQTPILGSRSSKSEEKCIREYSNLDITTTITTTTTTTTTTSKYPVYFAVGGVNAAIAEFPHMALLGYGTETKEYQCGGSLISDQFILTAAHCLQSRDLGPVSAVVLGDLDTGTSFDHAEPQHFSVIETFPHPDYDYATFYNDIALIKLDRPAIFTLYVKPACIQTKHDLQHDNLSATGWGALEFGGSMYNYLQKVNLNNLPIKNCLKTYGPQSRLPQGFNETIQICGGNLQARMDTCQGDSGGPLQLKIKDFPLTYRIVGITSFGSNCGLVPGVYTRVSQYDSWIESVVWP